VESAAIVISRSSSRSVNDLVLFSGRPVLGSSSYTLAVIGAIVPTVALDGNVESTDSIRRMAEIRILYCPV